ncbi:MAG: hypothetical protein NT056_06170 [Proteobacteria bacterium]|nr:hypothetical protein [Pseudomonadota bacterium]
MWELTRREKILIYFLAIIFPVYPSYNLIRLEHVNPGFLQYLKIFVVSFSHALVAGYLFQKGLLLKIKITGFEEFDVYDYLISKYTEEEQRKTVFNYRQFKCKFLGKGIPIFYNRALKNDDILKEYQHQRDIQFVKLFGGGFCYLIVLVMLYFFIVYV